MKNKLKKGFTLVEGVIALTVVVIISAAITTMCIYSAKTTPKIYAKFQASNIVTDVVTCFTSACEEDSVSDKKTAFESYLTFYVGCDENIAGTPDNETTPEYYTYSFTMCSVKTQAIAYFSSEKIEIKTYYGSSDSTLYTYSYPAATKDSSTSGDSSSSPEVQE